MDPFIGTVVAGRYRVTDAIGKGGMGTVYRAVQENLDRNVALKVILAHHLSSPDAVARFEREARTIAKLNHENIITIHDFGTLDDGGLFIVMELLNGRPLTTLVTPSAPMSWPRTLLLMRDVARALAAAHSHNIIHRDLKPDNIMVVGAGDNERAKVLDFGVAKLHGDQKSNTLTEAGIIVGTPAYMAPEVVLGDSNADAKADLFSLGLVWFELLTGTRIFDGASPSATLVQVATKPIPSLRDVDMRAPDEIADIVDGLLKKDPSLRTPTAQVLLELIDKAIEHTASGQFEKPARLGAIGAERAVRRTLSDTESGEGAALASEATAKPVTLALGSVGAPGVEALPEATGVSTSQGMSSLATPSTSAALIPPPQVQPKTGNGKLAAGVVVGVLLSAAVVAVMMRGPSQPSTAAMAVAEAPPAPAPTPAPAPPVPAVETPAPILPEPSPAPAAVEANVPTTVKPTVAIKTTKAKKPKLAATSTTSDATTPKTPPPLTSDLVEEAIQKNLGKAAACRNTNITNAKGGGGLLVDHCPSYKTLPAAQQLFINIDPTGKVTGVRLRDAQTAADPLAACVLESLKGWRFPEFAGDAVEIGQRLTFKTCVPINGKCVFSR